MFRKYKTVFFLAERKRQQLRSYSTKFNLRLFVAPKLSQISAVNVKRFHSSMYINSMTRSCHVGAIVITSF